MKELRRAGTWGWARKRGIKEVRERICENKMSLNNKNSNLDTNSNPITITKTKTPPPKNVLNLTSKTHNKPS